MIRIRKPLSFMEIGRKDNQEDYLFPEHADEKTRVFILCDGMGGHDNGEVASKTAANALGDDNYTCWLIPIDKVKINDSGTVSGVIQADEEVKEETIEVAPRIKENALKRWIRKVYNAWRSLIEKIKHSLRRK